MHLSMLMTRSLGFQTLRSFQRCCYATEPKDVLSDLEVEEVPSYEVEPKFSVQEVDRIRNKSRLNDFHRRILHNEAPFEEPKEYFHNEVWYRMRIMGRYGLNATMANPKYCWPTKEEVDDVKEYEKVLYPHTIQEVWKQIEEKKAEEALKIKQREEEIDKAVANMDKWQAELEAKKQKKEAELLAAKEQKEAMLEEIREQFGFQIDVKDERFQEMLEKKEKEDKKKKKEEKKRLRAEKMLAFVAKSTEMVKEKEQETLNANDNVKNKEKKADAKEDMKPEENQNKKMD